MNLEEFMTALVSADGEYGDITGCTVVQDGEWELGYKDSAYRSVVVSVGGNFFEIISGRTGSHYTEYFYDDDEVRQVVPKKITTTIYVPI